MENPGFPKFWVPEIWDFSKFGCLRFFNEKPEIFVNAKLSVQKSRIQWGYDSRKNEIVLSLECRKLGAKNEYKIGGF